MALLRKKTTIESQKHARAGRRLNNTGLTVQRSGSAQCLTLKVPGDATRLGQTQRRDLGRKPGVLAQRNTPCHRQHVPCHEAAVSEPPHVRTGVGYETLSADVRPTSSGARAPPLLRKAD